MPQGRISTDAPRADVVRELLERHLAYTNANTAPEDVHALDVDSLLDASVTFFSVRVDGELLGVAALKRLDAQHAEIKSMHTAQASRGRGIGRAMVDHLIGVARERGYRRVSLETGAGPAFAPARALCLREGRKAQSAEVWFSTRRGGFRRRRIDRETIAGAGAAPEPRSCKRSAHFGGEMFMDTKAHRFTVGSIECIPVADGTYLYTADALFANAPRDAAAEVVREHGLQPEEMVLSYTALVINTGEHRVLVDTGLGAGVVPSAGALSESLRAEGIGADEIDTVILTHGHPDHIGGNLGDRSSPAFPNARYAMWKADWDFWTSESTLEKFAAGQMYGVAEIDKWIGEAARTNLPPIQDQIDLIERETEIVPGVHALPAPGHTPGHMGLVISSGDEQALHIADAVLHPIHLEQPDWYPLFDIDADQAAATRRRLLDRAAAEQCMVIAYHFPFPSAGRVLQRAKGWAWEPV